MIGDIWKMKTPQNLRLIIYYVSIARRFHLGERRAGWNFEIFDRVGAARVERRHVFRQKFGDAQVVGFNAFNNTPGQFIASVIVMARAVTFFERQSGLLRSQCFIKMIYSSHLDQSARRSPLWRFAAPL